MSRRGTLLHLQRSAVCVALRKRVSPPLEEQGIRKEGNYPTTHGVVKTSTSVQKEELGFTASETS